MRMVNVFSRSPCFAPVGPGPGHLGVWRGHGAGAQVLAQQPGGQRVPPGFVACDSYAGGEAAMAQLTCPVLFALGSQDQMTDPKAAKGLVKAAQAAGAGADRPPPVGHNTR